jgi:hypothetical protein
MTPAGARHTTLHDQLRKLAARAKGVDAPEASYALTIATKTARARLAELEDEGLIIKAVGGWQGRRIRWFVDPLQAAVFAESARRTIAPKEVERRAKARAWGHGLERKVAEAKPDHRFTVPDSYRGEFAAAGIGGYLEPPASCAARAVR